MHNKFIFFNNNRVYYYIIIAYSLLLAMSIISYKSLGLYEEKVKESLLSKSIGIIDDTSSNIMEKLLKDSSYFVVSNIQDSKLRAKNRETLSLLKNEDIESIYILYLLEGKYFFLIDTDETNPSEVNEPFIPEDMNLFLSVEKSQRKKIGIQKNIDNIAFTLVKPMVQENKTVAFLVMDYKESRLSSLLNVSVNFLTYLLSLLLVVVFLFLCYVIYTKYRNYKIYHNSKTNTLNRIYLINNYDKIEYGDYYIALADIDFFKRVNMLYGQHHGDEVIVSMIKTIASWLNKNDMLIQYSGEEFLLFIHKKSRTPKEAKELLESIREAVESRAFKIENEEFNLTISMGVVLKTEVEKSLQDVIHKADTALYHAKHHGRNRLSYYEISQEERLYREKLKEMIASDNLCFHYQDIRDLKTKKLHHYEALMRINDGEKILYPDTVLPGLEDSYLYTYLSKKVITHNINIMRKDEKIKIAINLSADDIINESILALLEQNSDLSPRLLIEILETKSIDFVLVEASIQRLKSCGYRICIDDFGAGYANLNHLLKLSIDFLKIDGSIIKEIVDDKRAYSLVKTFAIFCKENDIEIIAEFVENQEIVDILVSLGVSYGQGWYFSKAELYEKLGKEHK